jgi:membrane carboxypeptidase/penicillin-binding protein PbpC
VVEWFPDAAWAARAVCAFHRLERGRRVVDWPEEYREWAGDASHSEDEATRPPRITSPADGSVYYFDPSLGDAAAIRVGAINAGSRANWTLDGRRIETGMAEGDSFLLPPVPGEHVLEIEAPGGSDRVRFSVR